MNVSISNIAWRAEQDQEIARCLQKHGIKAIDIAPSKYFPVPKEATVQAIQQLKDNWARYGIEIVGMQSLLFGTHGLNLFGSIDLQKAMLEHLAAICRIAQGLQARFLVFGSPKNRDSTGFTSEAAFVKAVDFFQQLAKIAMEHQTVICLEPNPRCYGANFMVDSAETAAVVEAVGHPAIRMQLDTGALCINQEDPLAIIQRYATIIGHIHVSEPHLLGLGQGDSAAHRATAEALTICLPQKTVTIEMLTSRDNEREAIEQAIKFVKSIYQADERGNDPHDKH